MNDAAPWFALIALAVTGWGYAFALAFELKRVRQLADGRKVVIDEYMIELEDADRQRASLRKALAQASKNDNRDASGRYAKA